MLIFFCLWIDINRVATWSGNQENFVKTKKNDKSQKNSGKNGSI